MSHQWLVMPPPGLSPAETARWMWDLEQAWARLLPSPAPDQTRAAGDGADPEPLFAIMARWDEFNPAGAQRRHQLIGKLQELGYSLTVPDTRDSGTSQRTYLKVLRNDGVNAGFINSSTFTFVKARSVLTPSDLVKTPGRYPWVKIDSDAAIEFIARVAAQFATSA